MSIGATERVAARLMAVRMPEAIVKERRRVARKNAQTKGYTPSPSPPDADGLEPLYDQRAAHQMADGDQSCTCTLCAGQSNACLSPGRALSISPLSQPKKKIPPDVICMGACSSCC